MEKELVVLSNKSRYIQELLDNTIDLRKKKKDEINAMLIEKGYSVIDDDNDFKYLVKMPMDSVSEENVDKINKDYRNKLDELERVKSITIQQMWLSELEILENEYVVYIKEREQCINGNKKVADKLKEKKVVKKSKKIILEIDA
jgi:DNA topoisomerase-2